MMETKTLLRLMSWLSPVFPIGGFAYSAGLEQAASDNHITEPKSLEAWLTAQLMRGSLWNDAVIFAQAHSHARYENDVTDLSELAVAMIQSNERVDETLGQGTSFHDAAINWIEAEKLPPRGTSLPIIVGYCAGLENIDCEQALGAFLHNFVSNQLQCAIRLSVTGQSGAAKLLAKLEPVIGDCAKKAAKSSPDDLGACTFGADIAMMNHETMQPRLFRS